MHYLLLPDILLSIMCFYFPFCTGIEYVLWLLWIQYH